MATEAGKLFLPINTLFDTNVISVMFNYVSRSAESTSNTFVCPFAELIVVGLSLQASILLLGSPARNLN